MIDSFKKVGFPYDQIEASYTQLEKLPLESERGGGVGFDFRAVGLVGDAAAGELLLVLVTF